VKILACPSGGCGKKFDAAIALLRHVKKEHPGSYEQLRPFISQAQADELRARRFELLARESTGELDPVLRTLYKRGCPCGRNLQWHEARAREIAGVQPLLPKPE
jgi:hypothetical protein